MLSHLLSGVQRAQQTIAQAQEEIASGLRVQTPADDPVLFRDLVRFDRLIGAQKDAQRAIEAARARLAASESALADLQRILTRARAIAVQQANATISAAERQAAANELQRLIDRALADGNARWQGEYLFAGTAVDRPAFARTASGIVYQGTSSDRLIALVPDRLVVAGVRGDAAPFADTFQALEALHSALTANDTAGIQQAIGLLRNAHEGITALASELGARMQALDGAAAAARDWRAWLEQQRNAQLSADIPAASARMQQAIVALQASYLQIARMQELTLTRFLR